MYDLVVTQVFIDESGDAGFKFGKGSSDFFVIAMIIFGDESEMTKTSIAIGLLKRKIGFEEYREFKFHKLSKEVKITFFTEMKKFRYKIISLYVDKRKIKNLIFKDNIKLFYIHAVKMLKEMDMISRSGIKIKLDGGGGRLFRRQFSSYLRKELNSNDNDMIYNLKFVDSKSNSLIQLADMVAGALRKSVEGNKKDKDIYRNILKKNIETELCI